MADQWINDPNYTHGLVIPLVSAFIMWRKREELGKAGGDGTGILGLAVVLLSFALLVIGTAASEHFTMRISLPLLIFGAVLFVKGREFTRIAAFPVLLLLLMVPIPYIIYYKISFPMQVMSAKLSSGILNLIKVSVIRKGNILLLPGYTLEVVAACSGLRSLMTMFTLAVIVAYFSSLSISRKIILALCAVPVAIAANTVRLVVTALGAYTIGPAFAEGIIHDISGLIVFLVGLTMLLICMGILRWSESRQRGS
jgi:exosortase